MLPRLRIPLVSAFCLLIFVTDDCTSRVLHTINYPQSNNKRIDDQVPDTAIAPKIERNRLPLRDLGALSTPELNGEMHYLYRVQHSRTHDTAETQKSRDLRYRRSISNAVIETARCEHIELLDCDDYDSDEMTCMVTATGMPCCICTGRLKSLNTKKWSLW